MKRIKVLILVWFISILCLNFINISYTINAEQNFNKLTEYKGTIEHIFTHCLLAFPEIAFSDTNPLRKYYERDCITKSEFNKILDQLYKNNYILINANDIFKKIDEKIIKQTLYIPKNKKPLIFSFDDVVYDSKKLGFGMVDKIILNERNEIVTSTKIKGKEIISNTNEFIPLLNNFVEKHPDFSHNNAKGMICLTGYDGILGYRTQKKNKYSESEKQKVMPIINKLKEDGWYFACHSFGHYHMKELDVERFNQEIVSWKEEVQPLIGQTKIYVYPYGEWEILDQNKNISLKHQLLINNGFELYCGVGLKNFFTYLPKNPSENKQILFMDRKAIDGYTLKTKWFELSHLFDCKDVIDKKFRDGY